MGEENERIKRMNEKLLRELGPNVMAALSDDAVVEIMLNPDETLWEDRHGQGMRKIGMMDKNKSMSLLGTVAGMLNVEINGDNPIVEGELPLDGSRFEGLIPPIVKSPVFTIRKKAHVVFTLDEYVLKNVMTNSQRDCIVKHVVAKSNILIVGGTGSGKTTLANAILGAISEHSKADRVVLIEDTYELQCSSENVVYLRTSTTKTANDLLRATMRLRPDRICVGEVRDRSAYDLLKAWNTGHPGGLATIHANHAEAGLVRLEQLIEEAGVAASGRVVAQAVNLIISIQKTEDGRKIKQICEVVDYDVESQAYRLRFV